MTERENFLTRWSRKKLEADDAAPPAPSERAEVPQAADAPQTETTDASTIQSSAKEASPTGAQAPAFDIASLPSLESITAATDVRPFLMPGVPTDLARAALRRAWAADPTIRDFVGLAENAWDFTKPDTIEGFGDLPPGLDIKKMVAEVFGEGAREPEAAPAQQASATDEASQQIPIAEESSSSVEAATGLDQAGESGRQPEQAAQITAVAQLPDEFVRRDSNTALQQSSSEDQHEPAKVRRGHGRALPQ